MKRYTASVSEHEKEKFDQWVELAKIIYGFGLIRSSEAALFLDLSSGKRSLFTSDKENVVIISQPMQSFLSDSDTQLALIHNHIGKETSFSNRDIEVLLDYPRIQYLLVINSKMEVYILGKSPSPKSRDAVMDLYWDWWSNSVKKEFRTMLETMKILSNSPYGIHATNEEYEELLSVELEVVSALHNMTNHIEFLKFADDVGFYGAYLSNC